MTCVPPRALALCFLRAMFASSVEVPGIAPVEGPSVRGPGTRLTAFQEEGAARVRAALRRRGGAVLADSVGLGKTYVALALIEEAVRSGGDVVVVVPAALRRHWRATLKPVPQMTGWKGPGWKLLSHTSLARGVAIPAPKGARLVVVDEAHRFRNPHTLRYSALARLVASGEQPAPVLLITATPVNNSPDDLLHLLRLFAHDDAFRDVGVPSLQSAFCGGPRSRDVEAIIRALVVRRTRAMVRTRFGERQDGEIPRFPARARPRILRYADPDLPDLVGELEGLELVNYGAGDSAFEATRSLIRLNLLKRLDSSPAAFQTSADRLERLVAAALEAAEGGTLLDARDVPDPRSGDEDPLQLIMVDLVSRPAPAGLDLSSHVAALERDMARIDRLRRERVMHGKLTALVELLESCRAEKVVVFTEYRDTARALWRVLAREFRVGRIDGSGAWLGQRRAGRSVVIERFAPHANRRPAPAAGERVDVLIATDVLAEGQNLQDARYVVSYDLPWNPVRLLQRIGRLDRLESPHHEIIPCLFVPDSGLEEVLGLVRRLRTKLNHIAGMMGGENAEAVLEGLVASDVARRHSPDFISTVEAIAEPDDPIERLRTLWVLHRSSRVEAYAPHGRCTIPVQQDSVAARVEWVVLTRSGEDSLLIEVDRRGRTSRPGPATVAVLETALAFGEVVENGSSHSGCRVERCPPPPLSRVYDYYRNRQAVRAVPAALPPTDPARRLASRLKRAMAHSGTGLDPIVARRADALLAGLAAPLSPIHAAAVHRLLAQKDPVSVIQLMNAAESALEGSRPRSLGMADCPVLEVEIEGAMHVVVADASRS